MILSQMQSEVLKICGNMQSSHPLYILIFPTAGTESTSLINRAANRFLRIAIGPNADNADAFPELKDAFTVGPTVNATNTIARPTNCLAIQNITSAHSNTSPTWDVTREFSMKRTDRKAIGLLTKDSTATGWPVLYALISTSIMIWPTPSNSPTNYVDYLRVYGIKKEALLVNAGDTLSMNADWHGAVVRFAAAMLCEGLDYADQAQRLYASVYDQLERSSDVSALETYDEGVSVDMAPDRNTVYGS